jgi:hypothetical protein
MLIQIRISIMFLLYICIFLNFSFVSCSQSASKEDVQFETSIVHDEIKEFTRDSIISRLNYKINHSIPLIIHVFVPLCDNDNQGIVKVGGKLGEGRNLKSNLYWGAGYGLKTWFSRSKDWKIMKNQFNIDSSILERAVYFRKYPNKAKVYLIIDAYAGDKMKPCLEVYFKSLAGIIKDSINLDTTIIPAYGKSDFLIFNAHNGLMDTEIEVYRNYDNIQKDAAVISCASYSYFVYRFKTLKAYPLVCTTSLLPPEAYIISAIIDNWATMQSNEKIKKSAGEAMAKVHKLPVKSCIKTFCTGW